MTLSLTLTLLSATAAAAETPAEMPPDEASTRFDKGADFYKQGDYKLALIEFERAYDLTPNYRVLFNIGQVNAQLNNYAKALRAFRRYLDEGGSEIPEARRRSVEDYIAVLLDRVASFRVVSNVRGAAIFVDDLPVGKAGAAEPLLVDAGQHVVRVQAPGYEPESQVVTLAGRDSSEIRVLLRATKAPVILAVREHKRSQVPVIVGWSATGLFAVSGMLTAILSANSQATLRSLRESSSYVSQGDMEAVQSRAKTYALVADISIGAAIVSTVVATYLTLRPDPTPSRARATPPGTSGITATFSPTGVAGTF